MRDHERPNCPVTLPLPAEIDIAKADVGEHRYTGVPGAAQPATELADRLASAVVQAAAACTRSGELQQWTAHVLTEAQAVRRAVVQARRQRRTSSAGRDLMQRSEYARLLARLETMPVIEQAKGILMAQSHCGNAQAFDLLRQASQRSNVPVRELAAQIVAKTTQVLAKCRSMRNRETWPRYGID